MSCQQAPRFTTAAITNTTTTAAPTIPIVPPSRAAAALVGVPTAPEDPYVFTETAPTTPPVLFNAQKTRARLTDIVAPPKSTSSTTTAAPTTTAVAAAATTTTIGGGGGGVGVVVGGGGPVVINTILPPSNGGGGGGVAVGGLCQKLPLAQLNGNSLKAQASFTAAKPTAANVVASLRQLNSNNNNNNNNSVHNNNNNSIHILKQQQQLQLKKLNKNVCIVGAISPKPKQQQQQKLQLQQQKPQRQQQQQQQPQEQQQPPPLPQLVTPSLWQIPLALDTLTSSAATATAVAAVSPTGGAAALQQHSPTSLVPLSPSAAPLPPSKFHHTTLAQHLQKVQCIKKPKKVQSPPANIAVTNGPDATATKAAGTEPPPLHALETPSPPPLPEHSVSASISSLKPIPANLVYRLADTSAGNAASSSPSLSLFPPANVLQDIIFVGRRPTADRSGALAPPPSPAAAACVETKATKSKREKSSKPKSKAKPKATKENLPKDSLTPEQPPSADALCGVSPLPPASPPTKTTKPRKATTTTTTAGGSAPKRGRKSVAAAVAAAPGNTPTNKTLIPPSVSEVDTREVCEGGRTEKLPAELLYCLQQHWLTMADKQRYTALGTSGEPGPLASTREERIAQHKQILQRQAWQLLQTHSLQKPAQQAAKLRLLSVDRLLRKYRRSDEAAADAKNAPAGKCIAEPCENAALPLAAHCQRHITRNGVQQIFLPCSAVVLGADGGTTTQQCRIPVFDILHQTPLCEKHAASAPAALMQTSFASMPDAAPPTPTVSAAAPPLKTKPQRKRKAATVSGAAAAPVVRAPKRLRKTIAKGVATTTPGLRVPPPLSAVLKRKSSTTSLESIASNSHSSSNSSNSLSPNSLSPPALAPLSGGGGGGLGSHRMLNFGGNAAPPMVSNEGSRKAHEINHLVAQFAMVANNNNHNKNNSQYGGYHGHNNSVKSVSANNGYLNGGYYQHQQQQQHHQQPQQQQQNHNHVSFLGSSNSSFISHSNANSNFNSHVSAKSNSNLKAMSFNTTSSGVGSSTSSSSLPSSADELLTQDMLNVCENSSAYASSEDTGLGGGFSETELMAGAADEGGDCDEIPLDDTRLLEEHDLANVLSGLPVDAFSELFTAVRQDECDEIERALELADKHIKSLQQTMGGGGGGVTSACDLFSDFLDDDILADEDMCGGIGGTAMMHSPNVADIDAATLFMDSNSGCDGLEGGAGGGGGGSMGGSGGDLRGLLLT